MLVFGTEIKRVGKASKLYQTTTSTRDTSERTYLMDSVNSSSSRTVISSPVTGKKVKWTAVENSSEQTALSSKANSKATSSTYRITTM
jgi:hypothetical protein